MSAIKRAQMRRGRGAYWQSRQQHITQREEVLMHRPSGTAPACAAVFLGIAFLAGCGNTPLPGLPLASDGAPAATPSAMAVPISVTIGGTSIAETGSSVVLTATVSGATGTATYAWSVTSGSGTLDGVNARSVRVTCNTEGTTTVAVTASDSGTGTSAAASLTVTCTAATPPAEPLAVTASADDTTPAVGDTIALLASATGGTPPYTYSWAQTTTTAGATVSNATTQTPSVTFSAAGSFTFQVLVQDAAGPTATATVGVTVEPPVEEETADIDAILAATWGVAAAVDDGTETLYIVVGTAFAVDNTRLATNAHVVDGVLDFAAEAPGEVEFVVVQHETAEARAIDRMWRHPDYDPNDFLGTPDVGVISVVGSLPSVAPLADEATVRDLATLDDVALCGFPGDVLLALDPIDASVRPRATCLSGNITALRPFDPSVAATRDNTLLLQHDIQTSPGTSGSAIFDDAGWIVGVHNAATGDVSASNRFGVRADVIRTLLRDIDSGSVPALTLDSSPSGSPLPSGVCPATTYRNDAFGFGFNPPPSFYGPYPDDLPGTDNLLEIDFVWDEFLQIDIDVNDVPGTLNDWALIWVDIKSSSGETLLLYEEIELASGVDALLLEWYSPGAMLDFYWIELWVKRGSLLYSFDVLMMSSDFFTREAQIIESLRSVCVD